LVQRKKTHKDYESAVSRLEEIADRLEAGEVSLEDSIKLYSEALEITRQCHQQLDAAEKKIKLIVRDSDQVTEVDFEGEEDPA
jgi:exodeoxyribonuclease VII small subunit